jgi:hypothetical protein
MALEGEQPLPALLAQVEATLTECARAKGLTLRPRGDDEGTNDSGTSDHAFQRQVASVTWSNGGFDRFRNSSGGGNGGGGGGKGGKAGKDGGGGGGEKGKGGGGGGGGGSHGTCGARDSNSSSSSGDVRGEARFLGGGRGRGGGGGRGSGSFETTTSESMWASISA